jgi:hypothetical protein
MMRCILFYHHIISGEELCRPIYVTENFEHYTELFVTHVTTIFTLDGGAMALQAQV